MLDVHHRWNASYKPLVIGFILSLLLTVGAYIMTLYHVLTGWLLVVVLSGLALIQALTQLILFLHLGIEPKPRWNLMMFFFMVLVIIVVIGGSLLVIYK